MSRTFKNKPQKFFRTKVYTFNGLKQSQKYREQLKEEGFTIRPRDMESSNVGAVVTKYHDLYFSQ